MLKLVLFVALAANAIFVVSGTGQNSCNNKCNKPNEVYEVCPATCPFRTCGIDDRVISCAPPPKVGDPNCSPPACRCKSGFYRDDKGNCVKWENCPVCKKPNEVYDPCPAPCPPRRCDVDDRVIRCKAPPQLGDPECEPGCRCADGYARNDKGICIPRDQCSVLPCRKHEVYEKCPNPCLPQKCSEVGFPIACPASVIPPCGKPACVCEDGYYRNCDGVCIPSKNCPSCGGDPNARPGCGNCRETCSNYNSTEPIYCTQVCYSNACDCLPGYVLDNNTGKCVRPKNCTPVCGKDEVYSSCVNGGCDKRNCSQLSQPKVCIDPIKCLGGCICREGYLRDDNGVCVPIDQCGCSNPSCKKNEVYNKCPNPCKPQKCSEVGFPIACPASDEPPCGKPACVCDDGYYRNCDGVCIPSKNCPSCGGDPNARPGCGNCRKTCANYNSTDPIMCIQICYDNACDCLPGYVLDGNTGKCVRPKNCSPVCGKDEVYTSCVNGGCDKRNCSQLSQPTLCIDPIKCVGGCICRKDYLRDSNGVCVPIDQCGCGIPVTTSAPKECSCDNVDEQLDDLEEGNTGFTGKFFYEIVKSNPGVSVIMSAFSVLTPLAELGLYTSGAALEELLNVLGLQNKDEIRCVFPKINDLLEAEQNNTLDLAAKVFVNQDYLLTDEFKKDTQDVFDAEAENIDVGDPDKAAATINDWAAEQTRNLIKGIISPDSITAYTRLILANAIYFKGTWKIQFDPKNTEDKDFSVTKDNIIQVKTMKVKDKFKYAESSDLDAKIIELPYVGEAIRFIGILPNDIEGLTNLVEKLQDASVFNKAINSLSLKTVTVLLPVMDVSTKIDLIDVLQKTGVTKIFDAKTAGLTGIIQSDEPLYVSDATQKATIKVNEEGSEAAAVNVVGISTTSVVLNPPPELFFNVDHPVVYYILYEDIPLFSGTFVKP
ncbi:zonadhesin-like [Achroia grisella]|uniref:zonadhesin-like n=1 Tax=Achroia grisella TaxID=688607 RepID=UPI0027D34B9C|nr:zonadhesin-like [Achroia grisella]